ncbi:MAG: choloylglycine hydrolase family protein [Clostridiales bacterium]|jgi:penicillin V acylase-like amidase (Ntn superfamily)|nr:choloylglycine hydrolase family protein [Clostridiales bacterium]
MCTAITLQSSQKANYIGRTLDFSYPLQPHFYAVPKNYRWKNVISGKEIRNSYSFIGIGQEMDGVLSFFDGVNEHGFAAAALYFAGYAQYDTAMKNPAVMQVASYDFLHYILGHCISVEDLRTQINRISIVGMTDPMTQTVAPLHWIAADQAGKCVVLEQTGKRLELFSNPIGIFANSPDFLWHMTNLRNYMEASPHQTEETVWGGVRLTPFGQAGGTVPLPGGYTSPERFVRAAYLKTHIPKPESPEASIFSFFQIMKSVSIPKGAVVTDRGTDDYTQYTAFININSSEYFFNTYENLQIKKAGPQIPETSSAKLVDLGELIRPMTFEKL